MNIGITDRLVRSLIGAGSLAMLYGPPGSGKSFLALDMGIHIAAGREWFGMPVERCGVLYIAAEGQHGIGKRIAAFRKRHGLDVDAPVPFAALPQPVDLCSPRGDTAALIATVNESVDKIGMKIGLIVVDTLSRCFGGGNENSPEDMGAFQANIDRIRTETSAAVLIVHHAGKDETKGMRGHSILLGAADTVIEVSGLSGTRSFTVRKQKDGETGTVYAFNLDVVEVGIDDLQEAITSCVIAPAEAAAATSSRLTANQQTMFSVLRSAGKGGLTVDEWNDQSRAAGIGIRRRADLHDFREALKSKKLVYPYGDRWYVHN